MSISYFEENHQHLKNDYLDKTGLYSMSCTVIAINLAKLLIEEKKKPQVIVIEGAKIDEAGNRAPLAPTPYDGRVEWGAHVVCVSDGFAYDPMMRTPMPLQEYLSIAFRQKIEIEDCTDILVSRQVSNLAQ